MINPCSKRRRSRRGVALIVTVGFLAVLILMAVAFSISMRVERLAARNFSDTVQSRQWAQSALSYAMRDLESTIANDMVLTSKYHVLSSSSGGGKVVLCVNSATSYVPASLTAALKNALSANDANAEPRWVDGKDVNGKTVARYAYQAFDCSGFLDANFGNPTNLVPLPSSRGTATNAFDLWLDAGVLQELTATKEAGLKQGLLGPGITGPNGNVSPWHEFSSLADMWIVAGSQANGNGLLRSFPENFFTYSRYPVGYWNSTSNRVVQPLALPEAPADWNKTVHARLAEALAAMPAGVLPNPDKLAWSIIDYCDGDTLADGGTVDTFATESTPLLNEFAIEVRREVAGTNTLVRIQPRVEVWFPFVGSGANTNKYSLGLVVVFGGSLSSVPKYQVGAGGGRVNVDLIPPGGIWLTNTYFTPQVGPGVTAPAGLPEIVITNNGDLSSASASLSAIIFQGSGAIVQPIVDSVTQLPIDMGKIGPMTMPDQHMVGKACNDPRFNAYVNEPTAWIETGWKFAAAGSTLPGTKRPTTPPLVNLPDSLFNVGVANTAGGDFPAGSTNVWIYHPNKPLATPGELGMLAFDPKKPWTTIGLLAGSPGFLPVLDRFVIGSNRIRHGKVNVNTWNENVLRTAFNLCPTNRYPGEVTPASAGMSSSDRDRLVQQILQKTWQLNPPIGLTNLSQIATIGTGWGTPLDAMQCEGVIRETAEILGVRQQIFTILVAAQALADDQSTVVGEQRAVAVVWRDPYPAVPVAGDPYHPTFLRFFRWLND